MRQRMNNVLLSEIHAQRLFPEEALARARDGAHIVAPRWQSVWS